MLSGSVGQGAAQKGGSFGRLMECFNPAIFRIVERPLWVVSRPLHLGWPAGRRHRKGLCDPMAGFETLEFAKRIGTDV